MRQPQRVSGRVTVTAPELRKGGFNASYVPVAPTIQRQSFTFTPSDWTADGSLYYVECTHNLRSIVYAVQITDTITGDDIFAERINRKPGGDTDKCRVWLATNDKYITVTIV